MESAAPLFLSEVRLPCVCLLQGVGFGTPSCAHLVCARSDLGTLHGALGLCEALLSLHCFLCLVTACPTLTPRGLTESAGQQARVEDHMM